MITPIEAKKLNQLDQAAVGRLDKLVTDALTKWNGETISIYVGGDGYTDAVRAKVMGMAQAAGWTIRSRSGDQRDPGPYWDVDG